MITGFKLFWSENIGATNFKTKIEFFVVSNTYS